MEKVVKKQKSYSLPRVWAEWLEKVYLENKEALESIDVTSETELLKVLAKLGLPRLEELVTFLSQSRIVPSDKEHGKLELTDKVNKSPPQKSKVTVTNSKSSVIRLGLCLHLQQRVLPIILL